MHNRRSRTNPPSFPRKRESRVGPQAGGACFTYTTSPSTGSYAKVSEGGNPGVAAAVWGADGRERFHGPVHSAPVEPNEHGAGPGAPSHTHEAVAQRPPPCHPPVDRTRADASVSLQQIRPTREVTMPPGERRPRVGAPKGPRRALPPIDNHHFAHRPASETPKKTQQAIKQARTIKPHPPHHAQWRLMAREGRERATTAADSLAACSPKGLQLQ